MQDIVPISKSRRIDLMREVGRVPYASPKINALIDAFNCGAGEDS